MLTNLRYDEPVFRPPSEANSLILQISLGCSQNKCGFCSMYKMKKFTIRPLQNILDEIKSIPPIIRKSVRRIFLADGDALVYPQKELVTLLTSLGAYFPQLARIGIYASPNSLRSKDLKDLKVLKKKRVSILYFGLESGDPQTLRLARKGFDPKQMLLLCQKAQDAGLKMSITAILGLAGSKRSREHATKTAEWITLLSPRYFSLLTLFQIGNDKFFDLIQPLTNGQLLEEALIIVENLHPHRTILRSNHVSNFLHLSGSYPKDRKNIIRQAEMAISEAKKHTEWYSQPPENTSDMF
ncbi:MAG: radical SAM protein [Bacteroidetes bacterium]|nr:radical SAM protein [Bacteroidota bacterium]